MIPVWVVAWMLANPKPERRLRMMRMERATPTRVPEPPKMLTPPSSTIVMMSSSNPSARLPRTDPSRAANSTPASPATNPDVVSRTSLTRSTLIPE